MLLSLPVCLPRSFASSVWIPLLVSSYPYVCCFVRCAPCCATSRHLSDLPYPCEGPGRVNVTRPVALSLCSRPGYARLPQPPRTLLGPSTVKNRLRRVQPYVSIRKIQSFTRVSKARNHSYGSKRLQGPCSVSVCVMTPAPTFNRAVLKSLRSTALTVLSTKCLAVNQRFLRL